MPLFSLNGFTILFIHVPKTGGVSVSAMLEAGGEKRFYGRIDVNGRSFRPGHMHACPLEKLLFPEMIDYAFLVVRNPVARMISEFRYQRRRAGLRWQRFLGFDRWLRVSLAQSTRNPGYRENHFRPQSDFVCFNAEVFRMEDGMERIAPRINEITGGAIATPLATHNASPRIDVRMTPESLGLILQRYAADFERFGYAEEIDAYDAYLLQ